MDPYKETFDTWNKIALAYQDKFMDLDLYNHTYDLFCNSISKPDAKLLEIGCGPGNISKYLLAQKPDFDLFGIDIAPNMVKLAKKNNPQANFAVMDSRHIHQLQNTYDGIIAGFCLPYLSPAESCQLITSAYTLLHSNGMLYLSFVEGDAKQSGFKEGKAGRVYFYYHQLNHINAHLLQTQFRDIQIFNVKYPVSNSAFEIHTIVMARK